MIWELTCLPRVVNLKYNEEEGFTPSIYGPIALKVCKESRKTIIRSYPLCFSSTFHPAKTRFNFSLDILYIGSESKEHVPHFFSMFSLLEISSIQVLALEDCYNKGLEPFQVTLVPELEKIIAKFAALREPYLGIARKLPEELRYPAVEVDPLPKNDDAEALGFSLWTMKKCEPVYGWRRCPMESHLEEDDEESFGLYGP
ncbi:hypothetical protein IFR05_017222 [Cadophora sp. M221]|nr:hypothetical protein IFR05_017222 [Cadophora sp. M221]